VDGIADEASETVEAWLPLPLTEMSLVTAIHNAMKAAATRRQLEQVRNELAIKETEADSLYEIGTALSTERDIHKLEDLILRRCRELTKADAGSFYLVDEDAEKNPILVFEVTQNDSIPSTFQRFTMPINDKSASGYVALTGELLHLPDVYDLPPDVPFHFNRDFDTRSGYRTKSMLVVPMKNHEGTIIGVLQLINHKRRWEDVLRTPEIAERAVTTFPKDADDILASFASQAAVALDNQLLLDSIEKLFEGFVRASVTAIEARDPTTSGHSERVGGLTVGIATTVSDIAVGRWKDVHFGEREIREIRYAGLLHDFGKIGVRENVLVKAKKLYDPQLDNVRLRFAYARKSLEADHNRRQLAYVLEHGREAFLAALASLDADFEREAGGIDEDLALVVATNEPTVLDQEGAARLSSIGEKHYQGIDGDDHTLLDDQELLALSVRRGSLTEGERKEIESHVSHTFRFLSIMPWTRDLKNVPFIAGAHHEKLDGTGYPRGLTSEEIPLQSKMMTIADIYDALTASDRPYKRAVPVPKALDILVDEVRMGHVDQDLLDVFIEKKVYEAVNQGEPNA
jgi:HD-GYP domain-containing protein (c-di-GMP phosphodiesterase class II)